MWVSGLVAALVCLLHAPLVLERAVTAVVTSTSNRLSPCLQLCYLSLTLSLPPSHSLSRCTSARTTRLKHKWKMQQMQ